MGPIADQGGADTRSNQVPRASDSYITCSQARLLCKQSSDQRRRLNRRKAKGAGSLLDLRYRETEVLIRARDLNFTTIFLGFYNSCHCCSYSAVPLNEDAACSSYSCTTPSKLRTPQPLPQECGDQSTRHCAPRSERGRHGYSSFLQDPQGVE